MASVDTDNEVQAIQGVISALSLVDSNEARGRVLEYASKRFGLQIQDIRTLRERKNPQSVIEMAVLVAYYLSELAPENERKQAITSADIEKYFKQAGFRLPRALGQTLQKAKVAGYFDSVAGGQYKLNPVGYNLVVHNLPGDASAPPGKPKSLRARRESKSVSLQTLKPNQSKSSRQRGV